MSCLACPSFLRQLPDGGFDVAAQLLRQPIDLHLLRFLGGVGKVFLRAHLGGIDRRLRAAQPDPHLLVEP